MSIAVRPCQTLCQRRRIPIWDTRGRLIMKKGAAKVPDASNGEELRRRLGVMKNALEALKRTNRNELQGEWAKVFEEYKEYLLREYVFGLSAKDVEGNVLAYEHAVRKHAVKLVNAEGKPWVVALKAAWKHGTVKERNFTTPLALYTKRPPPPWRGIMHSRVTERVPEDGVKGKRQSWEGQAARRALCNTHARGRHGAFQVQHAMREMQSEKVQVQAHVRLMLLDQASHV